MYISTTELLKDAQSKAYAVGAFNVYNMEGAKAVVEVAEEMNSPVILQLLPSALEIGGKPLVSMCLSFASEAGVPVGVHLDHCSSASMIKFALECGIVSIMADGSNLEFTDNVTFTKKIVDMVGRTNSDGTVEAELGKLSGSEDGLSVEAQNGSLTKPQEAVQFIAETGVNALAVCIGNIHGHYHQTPQLDFARLQSIRESVSLPLVLHGTSGLPDDMISKSIGLGVCKFNVNTEVRTAYLEAVRQLIADNSRVELVQIINASIEAIKTPIREKIKLFCSVGRA